MDGDYKELLEEAELLKALAHPVRLCIVKGLLDKGICNVTYMQNCLGVPQSTVSQHLQKLRAAKIVKGERVGLEISYSVSDRRVEGIINALIKNV